MVRVVFGHVVSTLGCFFFLGIYIYETMEYLGEKVFFTVFSVTAEGYLGRRR